MADEIFEDPELAALYDPLDPDRRDLNAYLRIVEELGAGRVLDIGCGTGTFALMLADRGIVTGLDPARASLDVAREKPGADRVAWVHGDIRALPPIEVDVATMTGNVAQAIAGSDDWTATLGGSFATLRPGGRLVFETRDPDARAWVSWTRERSYRETEVAGVGLVRSWHQVSEVDGPLVSFRYHVALESGRTLTSTSTLRFRTRDEVADALRAAGFDEPEMREASDRPGLELVFIARRPT
jgi:SAM-dependent methyltransferase